MPRSILKLLPLLFILGFLAPPAALADPWPDQAVAEFNQAAEMLGRAQTPQERAAAIELMTDVAWTNSRADGADLVADMLVRSQIGELAHAETVEALAVLAGAGALDPETYGEIVGPIVDSALELAEVGDILPSQAIALDDAIKKLDEVAAQAGLPQVSELAPELTGKLSIFTDLVRTYRDLKDLKTADEEKTKEILDRLLGLAGRVNPVFNTPAAVAFRDQLAWQKSMWSETTAGLDLVTRTMETGKFDSAAYDRIANRLKQLAKGPWGADTAKDFLKKLCDALPVLKKACEDLFDVAVDAVVNCSAIDCDCANVGGGILSGPNRVTCELTQASLRAACAAEGKVVGVCDAGASGPAATPK